MCSSDWLEHWTFNPQVLGSSPSVLKKNMNFSLISIDISLFLIITTILFFIGALGLILNRNNILITIMSIEIMLLAVNLNFIIFSTYLDDIVGYLFVLFILTIAATESAIGLAILSTYYKLNNTIQLESINKVI